MRFVLGLLSGLVFTFALAALVMDAPYLWQKGFTGLSPVAHASTMFGDLFGRSGDKVTETDHARELPEHLSRARIPSAGDTPADKLLVIAAGTEAVVGPIADTEADRPVFIDEVVIGYDRVPESWALAVSADIPEVQNCQPTRPASGTRIGHVYAGIAIEKTGFQLISAAQINDRIREYTETYQRIGEGVIRRPEEAKLSHVVVTETSEPVHLVLESSFQEILWHIHLAPGVEISGVTLLNGRAHAVSGLPDRIPMESFDNAAMAACDIEPIYPAFDGPNPISVMVEPALVETDPEAMQDAFGNPLPPSKQQRTRMYDRWFRTIFGVPALERRVGHYKGDMALVGPIGPKIAFQPLTGPLRLPEGTQAYGRNLPRYKDNFDLMINAMAEALVGGPLASVYPDAGSNGDTF